MDLPDENVGDCKSRAYVEKAFSALSQALFCTRLIEFNNGAGWFAGRCCRTEAGSGGTASSARVYERGKAAGPLHPPDILVGNKYCHGKPCAGGWTGATRPGA